MHDNIQFIYSNEDVVHRIYIQAKDSLQIACKLLKNLLV